MAEGEVLILADAEIQVVANHEDVEKRILEVATKLGVVASP